jgi:membrane protein DedA with SNARE-associated domain
MDHTVISWLTSFGAPAVFVLLMLGVFGLPIPDETVLLLAGVLVGRGQLAALPTAAAGASGAIIAITVTYALGRFAGLPFLLRYGDRIHIHRSLVARVGRWFDRFGKWLLTVGYFLPGVRHVTAFVAGASSLSAGTFATFAYTGAILWVLCFLSIGYLLGDQWTALVSELHRRATIVIIAGAGVSVLLWRKGRRDVDHASSHGDRPVPGPLS